jgi:uncharacterized hydrophobic protein (TIGR00271 family)
VTDHWVRRRLSLVEGTDPEGTIQRVTAGATLSAENLWLLICSAVLASIGLDVSSVAVIIGAMLISPLMGPIIGVGLGMGITHRALLQKSLRELGFATAFCLLASAAYFAVSPLGAPTTELIARTRPTLLDVGVAFFGGIAGIVAGSRRTPGMALPGVAIATALMPPLCAAGFGLGTGRWSFFLGAFYLFGLNAIFIALATFLVVRFLRFPHHEEATAEARRREHRVVATVATLAILPSLWFLYDAVRGARESRRIARFVEEQVGAPGRAAPQWLHEHGNGQEVLRVFVVGRPIDNAETAMLSATLARYGLRDMRLDLVQSDISARDLLRFREEVRLEVQRTVRRAVDSATKAAHDSLSAARARDTTSDSVPTVPRS